MPTTVLADLTPFLPSFLKKIPWQVRAALLVVIVGYALYIILAWIFGWPLSSVALHLYGAIALPAGLPALGNVTVDRATSQAITGDLEALAHAVVAELEKIGLPAKVITVAHQAETTVADAGAVASTAEAQAAVQVVAEAVDPAVAPEVTAAVSDAAQVAEAVAPPVDPAAPPA